MSSPDDSPADTPGGLRAPAFTSARCAPAPQRVPRVYIVQHEPRVHAAQLGIDVRALGVDICLIEAWRVPHDYFDTFEPDGPVVVLGGTMNAYADRDAPWLPSLRRFMQRACAKEQKLLGICLGHQLLAVANGGRVQVEDPAGEEKSVTRIQWVGTDPFVTAIGSPTVVFEDHADSVSQLPVGAKILATSDRYVQAMRLGSAVSVQFHPEVNGELLTDWYRADEPENLPGYRADYAAHRDELRALSDRLARWLTDPHAT